MKRTHGPKRNAEQFARKYTQNWKSAPEADGVQWFEIPLGGVREIMAAAWMAGYRAAARKRRAAPLRVIPWSEK